MTDRVTCEFRQGPVVLVSREISLSFPLAYAYLAGYLREKGEAARVLYRSGNNKDLVKQIMKLDPVLVGFGNLYPELKEIKEIIKMLDDAGRSFPIVIGGQMVTPTPEFAVQVTGADFGVIGEGEIILHRLVTALREGQEPAEVKGLAVRKGDEIIITGQGEFIRDLSKLPAIPYDLFPEEEWLHIGRWYTETLPQPQWRIEDRVINIHGGRGCPYKCNFCYHHSKPRYRSIADMMTEADEALERFDANMIAFSDDLVIASPRRARQLVDGIRNLKRPVNYRLSARLDILNKIDDDLLLEMKETGCRILAVGFESGSDRILEIIGKRTTADTMLDVVRRVTKAGMFISSAMMVGQHTETKEDVELSIQFMKDALNINPNIQFSFTVTTPFPGSELYDTIFKEGHLRDHQEFYDRYFSDPGELKQGIWKQVVNLSAMSDEEVIEMYNKIMAEHNKMKMVRKSALLVEFLKRGLGMANRIINSKLNNLNLPERGLFAFFLKTYTSVYFYVQKKLEHLFLKLRGF